MQGFYSTKRNPKKTIIELQALEVGIERICKGEKSTMARNGRVINRLYEIGRLRHVDHE